jgi:hypothetical protein
MLPDRPSTAARYLLIRLAIHRGDHGMQLDAYAGSSAKCGIASSSQTLQRIPSGPTNFETLRCRRGSARPGPSRANSGVGTIATDVAGHPHIDVRVVWMRILGEERRCRHDQSRLLGHRHGKVRGGTGQVAERPAGSRCNGVRDQTAPAGRVYSAACACTNSRMLVGARPVSRVKSSVMRS